MATRTALIITAILLPLITILVNSDVFIAQIFTDFSLRIIRDEPGVTTMNISNVGQVQANNVLFVMLLGNTVDDFQDMCPEGDMYHLNNKTLVAEFQRMSPRMDCLFLLTASEPVQFDRITAASDNRDTWVYPSSFSPLFLLGVLLLFVTETVLVILLVPFFALRFFSRFDNLWGSDKFHQIGLTDKTCDFVMGEYGIKICPADAYILQLIYLKKTTKNQLQAYTELPELCIAYRLWKIRQLELVSKEKLILDIALHQHFELYMEYD